MLLPAVPAFAQVCTGLPDFPTSAVTTTQDRDRMMCQLGLTYPVLPPRLEDPNRPVNGMPRDPNNPEGNWTDPLRHTVIRTTFGLWHTYDSDAGVAGGAMSGFGDYGPYSNPRYTDIDLLRMRAGAKVAGAEDWWFNRRSNPEELAKILAGQYGAIWKQRANDKHEVRTREDWWIRRRPEIVNDIQRDLYGKPIDPNIPISWVVSAQSTGTQVVGGVSYPYAQKTLTGTVDISSYPELRNTPRIVAQCRYPAAGGKRYPVVVTYGEGTARFQYTAPYDIGTCSYTPTQVQPDNGGANLSSYVIGLVNKGNWRKPDDPGSLVAWGWGISRLIDYLENDPDLDGDKVAVEGHSRYGKATLVTAAYDNRIAVAWPSDAGAMGTAPARRHYGQALENVASATGEYHWVNGNIMKFGGPLHPGGYIPRKVELLDVDAHATTSLLAPRAIFVTNGTDTPPGFGDAWADPRGTFLSGKQASPVWEFLGWKGQVIPEGTVFTSGPDESIGGTPPFNEAFIEGTVGWRRQIEGHTPVPNWPSFMIFASRYLNDARPVVNAATFELGEGPPNVVGSLTASDADAGDTVGEWQIKGGTGAAIFDIDADTGEITVAEPDLVDPRRATEYTLTVFAGDGKLPSHDTEVKVVIPDRVQVCHNNRDTKYVSQIAIIGHINHGDTFGTCDS